MPTRENKMSSVNRTHAKQAQDWFLRRTILSGPVLRAHRAFYYSVALPEGIIGRLQFCDLRGASEAERRKRRDEIALGDKVRVQVRSVHCWPTSLEIYLQELDI